MNQEPLASSTARSAIQDLGCPVDLFR
jgi:hypothetical protein